VPSPTPEPPHASACRGGGGVLVGAVQGLNSRESEPLSQAELRRRPRQAMGPLPIGLPARRDA
jgi:hypothetical protein